MDKDKSKAKGKTRFKRKPKRFKEKGEEGLPEHNHKGVIKRLVEEA